MQQYAEDAVAENMQQTQKEFLSKWGGRNPWIDENRDEIPGFRITHSANRNLSRPQ